MTGAGERALSWLVKRGNRVFHQGPKHDICITSPMQRRLSDDNYIVNVQGELYHIHHDHVGRRELWRLAYYLSARA